MDLVYRRTAELAGLEEGAHQELVIRRRFPAALDTGVPYFTLPRAGKHVEQVSEQVITDFGLHVVERVPGFRVICTRCSGAGTVKGVVCGPCVGLGKRRPRLISRRDDRHDFAIVGCDENSLAFWGTVRRLPYDDSDAGPKYLLLSSSRGGDASISGQPKYHIAGMRFPADKVYVTEGIIKAEIISWRLNVRAIGIYSTSFDEPTRAECERLARAWAQCS